MYRPMMSKKNMDCTSFCIFHQTITCNMEKSDAIPPCQLLQSGTVQATRSCPGFHPDGLRRHHQERLWGRGLHVTEYSARWRKTEKWCQTVTQKFKVSKLNHRNFQRINTESGSASFCRCGAGFLLCWELPRLETPSPAAYVPEKKRWVQISLGHLSQVEVGPTRPGCREKLHEGGLFQTTPWKQNRALLIVELL